MSKKLYKVQFIRQDNGNEQIHYVLAESMDIIEQEYSDIEWIRPLPLEEL